jgi:hypothetical protein
MKSALAPGLVGQAYRPGAKAITAMERRLPGASIQDTAKVASHVKERLTVEVYDVGRLETARRFHPSRLYGRDW